MRKGPYTRIKKDSEELVLRRGINSLNHRLEQEIIVSNNIIYNYQQAFTYLHTLPEFAPIAIKLRKFIKNMATVDSKEEYEQ